MPLPHPRVCLWSLLLVMNHAAAKSLSRQACAQIIIFKGIVCYAFIGIIGKLKILYSTPFLLKQFLNISSFSWRMFDVKISTPTCTQLKKIRDIFQLDA
jgi:hypothetical protein